MTIQALCNIFSIIFALELRIVLLKIFSKNLTTVFKSIFSILQFEILKLLICKRYIIKHFLYLFILTKENEQKTKQLLEFIKKSLVYLLGGKTAHHVNFMQPHVFFLAYRQGSKPYIRTI